MDFEEIAVDDDEALTKRVIAMSGQNTVPVLVHTDGRVEVGFDGELG